MAASGKLRDPNDSAPNRVWIDGVQATQSGGGSGPLTYEVTGRTNATYGADHQKYEWSCQVDLSAERMEVVARITSFVRR